MNKSTNSDNSPNQLGKNKLSNHFKNRSNIQQQKPSQSKSPLYVSQKYTDLTYHLQEIKSKCKSSVIQFHKNHLKMHHFSQDIFSELEEIDKANSLSKTFQHLFNILKFICSKDKIEEYQKRVNDDSKGLIIKIRTNQSTKLKLIKQEQPAYKTKTSKKIEELENSLLQVKKELFNLKQQKLQLQKKIITIIQEYQSRKKFYLSQIKKLTNIVNLSTVDIRKLVLQKTFEKRQVQKMQDHAKDLLMPLFQQGQQQLSRGLDNDGKMNRMENNVIQNFRNGAKQQGKYNVELKLLKNLDSIQLMQQNQDIYLQ